MIPNHNRYMRGGRPLGKLHVQEQVRTLMPMAEQAGYGQEWFELPNNFADCNLRIWGEVMAGRNKHLHPLLKMTMDSYKWFHVYERRMKAGTRRHESMMIAIEYANRIEYLATRAQNASPWTDYENLPWK